MNVSMQVRQYRVRSCIVSNTEVRAEHALTIAHGGTTLVGSMVFSTLQIMVRREQPKDAKRVRTSIRAIT